MHRDPHPTNFLLPTRLYPKWMFHLGKIIFIAQTAFIMLLLQVNIYKRLIVQLRPNGPIAKTAKVEPAHNLPM